MSWATFALFPEVCYPFPVPVLVSRPSLHLLSSLARLCYLITHYSLSMFNVHYSLFSFTIHQSSMPPLSSFPFNPACGLANLGNTCFMSSAPNNNDNGNNSAAVGDDDNDNDNDNNDTAASPCVLDQGQVAWQQPLLQRNRSFVVDLFQGQLCSMVTCNECGSISRTYDPFTSLSLPLATHYDITVTVTVLRHMPRLSTAASRSCGISM